MKFCLAAWLALQVATVGAIQAGPVILTDSDLADDQEPDSERWSGPWLGLYLAVPSPAGEQDLPSTLRPVTVRLVRAESDSTAVTIVPTPPEPVLLISGVPGLSPGPALTAARWIDLDAQNREAFVRLGQERYVLRLAGTREDGCNGVITLTDGQRTQVLFDGTRPGVPYDCDEPHYRVHWAGDLDRDGRLDLVATLSPKYSYHPRSLLLSSGAGSGALVREAGRYEIFSR